MNSRKHSAWLAAVALFVATAAPWQPAALAQHGGHNNGNRGNGNYYSGVHQNMRGGNYGQRYQQDDRNHHDNRGGGIGPGYGALIGAGGGAALGAVFGGGLKGTLIGGAAGAGLGALGGKLAQGNNHHDDHGYHH